MTEPLIQFVDVCKRFGDNPVLRGTDLSIFKGEVTTIIGKSGVGKSVLLKHIIGLIEPDSGTILFEGRSLSEMPKRERRALKRKFSYMFQGTALFDSMTVFENIALPLKERTRMQDTEIRDRVRDKMDALDLSGIDEKYPSQLSGGMNKRVALARALVTDPEIVLFDEPTTGLDPIRKNAVHSMISEYQKRFGFTGVVVSHEIPDIFFISQRVAMLDDGRIFVEGTPEEIQQSTDPVVRNFIHGLSSPEEDRAGLESRIGCEAKFDQEMGRLDRRETPFSIILFTFENLEALFDRSGHLAGQRVLREFADALGKRARVTDACCRYGINGILLILGGTNLDGARRMCAGLAGEMKKKDFVAVELGSEGCFNIRAGAAVAQKGESLEETVAAAESAQDPFYTFQVCLEDP